MSVVKKIPVFVFPPSLKFYLETKTTHSLVLTLYNPYDFPIRFKVLCTAPKRYRVPEPTGHLESQTVIDIFIRHVALTADNCDLTDKLRIVIMDESTLRVMGHRDIEMTLFPGEEEDPSSPEEDFHDFSQNKSKYSTEVHLNNHAIPSNSNYVIALVIGVTCMVVLFLPTQEEIAQPTSLPHYLHISMHLKMVLAYILGLVTMVIFRS